MTQLPKVLAAITNYEFSQAADELKQEFSQFCNTVLIDNNSPTPPKLADITLSNHFYTGLWNEAVQQAISGEYEWLLFCASDVQLLNSAKLTECISEVIQDETIGIFTPSLRPDSRLYFHDCFNRKSGGVRACHIVEGFFFLARTEILERVYPVDPIKHHYGYSIDTVTAFQASRMGYSVVVDDRCQIYHPKAIHEIDLELASEQARSLVDEYQGCQDFRNRVARNLQSETQWIQQELSKQEKLYTQEKEKLIALHKTEIKKYLVAQEKINSEAQLSVPLELFYKYQKYYNRNLLSRFSYDLRTGLKQVVKRIKKSLRSAFKFQRQTTNSTA